MARPLESSPRGLFRGRASHKRETIAALKRRQGLAKRLAHALLYVAVLFPYTCHSPPGLAPGSRFVARLLASVSVAANAAPPPGARGERSGGGFR